MQPIRHPLQPRERPPIEASFRIESALFSASTQDSAHALFAPLHYEPGYAYPLIVWLHGSGGDERQLMRVMPLMSMRNYVAVAPRGLCAVESSQQGYFWQQTESGIHHAEQQIFGSIEIVSRKFHVARRRVFLAGFDCGGTMAFRVAMAHPERFAGVLSLGGPFPTGRTPFSNLAAARRLPVFLAVGRRSAEYPSAAVCENLRLLYAAGILVTLRQYPCGHELAPQMLADVDRWIIEQMTAAPGSEHSY